MFNHMPMNPSMPKECNSSLVQHHLEKQRLQPPPNRECCDTDNQCTTHRKYKIHYNNHTDYLIHIEERRNEVGFLGARLQIPAEFRLESPNPLRFRPNRPESGSVQFREFRCFVHQNVSQNTTKIRPKTAQTPAKGQRMFFRPISTTVNRLEQVSIDLIPNLLFVVVTLKRPWM